MHGKNALLSCLPVCKCIKKAFALKETKIQVVLRYSRILDGGVFWGFRVQDNLGQTGEQHTVYGSAAFSFQGLTWFQLGFSMREAVSSCFDYSLFPAVIKQQMSAVGPRTS